MSKSIDQRIAEMRFDNKQFESGVQTSIKSLDQLKKALDLEESAKGLSNLQKVGRTFSLEGIASGVDSIARKFSNLGIIGITTLQNITNSAIRAGEQLLKSLTIDPISKGFQEYETQMNAVQTILANTQGSQKKVSQEAINAIKDTANVATQETIMANRESLENLKDTQEQKLREYKRLADEELDILEDKYDRESEALEKAIDDEADKLENAHREKLSLYEEEYMQRLKSVDEERYNAIKAIDKQIKGITDLTKAEEAEIERTEQKNRILELQNRIGKAKTVDDRLAAEKDLADYQAKIKRKELLASRDQMIEELNNRKDSLNQEFDELEKKIKKEYDLQKEQENELYKVASKNLKEQQKERTKILKENYETEKEYIKDRQAAEQQMLKENQLIELETMKKAQESALKNIEEKKNAEIKALTEVSNATTKGSTLEDVNKALDELNEYADKTIYNFTEMTRNIGTFTAAGIDLDTSVSAIKGIANLAAVSGSSSEKASMAMYQLSQALATGTVKLMDWNSVVNAGMGGQVFQEALKDTARVHGIAIDQLIADQGSFRDSLSEGWLSSEILTETLSKFTGDLTREQIKAMGYTDEQVEAIYKMGETAKDAATKVKTFTQLFDTLGEAAQSGWAQSWRIIIGDFEEAKTLLTELSDKFGAIIGNSAKARNEMLQFWKDAGGRQDLVDSLRNVFEAFESIVKPIKEAFQEIFPPMTGEKLASLTKGLEAFTEKLKIGDETADKIRRTFSGFFSILSIGKQIISAIARGVSKLITALLPGASSFLDFTAGIGDWLVALDDSIKKGDIFNRAIEKVADIIELVSEKIKIGITAISDFFKQFGAIDLSGAESFMDKVKLRFEPFSLLFEGIGKVFSKVADIFRKVAPVFYKLASLIGQGVSNLIDRISEAVNGGDFNTVLDVFNTGLIGALIIGIRKFVNSMSEVTGGFSGILDGVKDSLEAWQSSLKAGVLLKIAAAIAILAASLLVMSLIDSEKLAGSLAAITTLFVDLFGSMAIFAKIVDGPGFKGLTKMSGVLIATSAAILILSFAMTKLAKLDWDEIGKGLISVGALMAMLVASSKILSKNEGSMMKGALGLILFGAAINVLTIAVEKLGKLDVVQLGKGLLAVGVLMTELALFMKATDVNKMGISKATGILLLATAMVVLSTAVEKLGKLDLINLAKGLSAIGILLLELGIFINATPDAKKVVSTAIGMTILGAAMLIFGSAIEKMGKMPLDQIGKGLLAMAGSLAIVVAAMNFMPSNMIVSAAGLVIVAAALLILSNALTSMGQMTWEEIAKGLVTLAGSLGIIALAMAFMTTALPGAAALLIVAAALSILAPVLLTLGNMAWGEIGKGLLALAGVFAVIGVAGLLLAPLTPVILGLAAAIALFGVGCLAVGAGMLAFSAGLAALAVSGTAGAAALVAIVTAIIGLIPYLLEQLGIAIIAFANVIIQGMPVIMEAIKVLFEGLIKLFAELTPPLVLAVLAFILDLLSKLVEYIPQFIDAGMKLMIGFLKGISDNIKEVVETAIDIVLNFLDGIGSKLPDIIDAGYKLIISFINGLADAIRNNHEAVYDACENLITSIIEAITSLGERLLKTGENIVGGLIEGIKSMAKEVWEAAVGVVEGAVNGIRDFLGIKSPSKVFAEIGMYADKGLVSGLSKFSGLVSKEATNVGDDAMDSLRQSLSKVADTVDGDLDMAPTIRPVIDMTDVEKGLNSTFSKKQGLNVSASVEKVSEVAAQRQNGGSILGINQTTTNNTPITINNTYHVRNDNDIKKISQDLNRTIERFRNARGVPAYDR
jgi:tape measure domain-containing protein